jgi:hypothetical protein
MLAPRLVSSCPTTPTSSQSSGMEDMEDGVEEWEPSLGEGARPVGGSGSDNLPSDAAD